MKINMANLKPKIHNIRSASLSIFSEEDNVAFEAHVKNLEEQIISTPAACRFILDPNKNIASSFIWASNAQHYSNIVLSKIVHKMRAQGLNAKLEIFPEAKYHLTDDLPYP